MALFKIKRGLAANLPKTYVEGYCYVTTDDGKFYIDTSNAASGRIVLNAAHADDAGKWTTARKISISSTAGTTGTNIDGSAAASLIIPATMTGFSSITTNKLIVGTTSAAAHIQFQRESFNYLVAPKNGTIAFSPGSAEAAGDSSGVGAHLAVTYGAVIPGQNNNVVNLGSSSYKWKNVYATTFTGSLSGNASTATKLATARTINGVSFDGSKNISFQGSYISNTAVNSLPTGLSYIEMPGTATVTGDPTYGAMLTTYVNGNRAFQIVGTSGNALYFRGIHSSSLTSDAGTGYGPWRRVLDDNNYTSYTVTKTGSGASGTWGISISGSSASCTGNAATATSAGKWTNARTITLKGDASGSVSLDGSKNVDLTVTVTNDSHTHDTQYLKLSGGTLTGDLNLLTGNNDRFLTWKYATATHGADWRIGVLGTGSGDANYFVIQTNHTGSGEEEKPWTTAVQIGMNTPNVTFAGIVTMPSIKLNTARTFTTNLASTTAGSFDGSANVTVGVSGTLPVTNGGTGTATKPTQGGIIYASSATTYASTAAGSSGQLLQSAGTGKPTWITATNSNTASTVVKRDSSGNFSAGTITATLSGNASTASKWATARTITLKQGASGSVSIDGSANQDLNVTGISESYLTWGGKNFAGSYGPLDAAMISRLGADRMAFANAAGITIEYSTDSGATWTDYGATDAQKLALFGSGGTYASLTIGKNSTGSKSLAPYMLRVTVDTGTARIYTTLNKFAIYITTNNSSGCYCTIEKALQSTPTTYVTVVDKQGISGWSGWNIINVSNITTYGNTAASQYGRLRFTFGCTGGTSSTSYFGLQVKNIMGFGGMGHNTPSNMATHGHLYNWDSSQNATFPAKVTATSFAGSGASLTALNASNINAGTLAAARLPASGVTAGTYGLDAAASPAHGGKFLVPKIVVDTTGRITAAAEYEVTLPADSNTHYTTGIRAGVSGTNSNSEATNPYIKVLDDTTYRSQIQLAGSGLTTISSDTNGKITINTSINKANVTTALGYTPDTPAQVDAKVAALVDSAPSTLNTLNELAAALGDDANFATTVATNIGKKVAKAGDTMTGHLDGVNVSTSWIYTIRKGAFRLETAAHSSGAAAVVSMKTSTGAWSIANLAGNNNLYFVYGTDDNYSAGTNTTSNFYISTDGTYSGAASKLTLSDKGTSTKPIYLVKGVATECSTYAGGTAVTLNGSSKAASTASFYAPTGAGTSGYILKSNGTGAPTWLQILPVANGGTGNTAMTANRLVWSESASKLTAGYHYASSTKVAINSTSAPTETFYVNGAAKINGALTVTSLNLTSFAKTLTLSANTWTDTGISGSNLSTGTYIIQIERGGEYFSGVMSWTTGKDTSPSSTEGYDEIVLHNAGSIAGSTSHIMARTVRTTNGIKLQIYGTVAMASATVNIKCAKII